VAHVTVQPMPRLLLLLPLTGCYYTLSPEARICEDVAFAISERTLVCLEDEALANARYHRFMDEATCLLDEEVTDPYNPEGILPPDEQPEEVERLERAYDCVRAIRGARCGLVRVSGDDLSWWLSLDEGCLQVATVGGQPDSGVP
jgi:hypothetical protein